MEVETIKADQGSVRHRPKSVGTGSAYGL